MIEWIHETNERAVYCLVGQLWVDRYVRDERDVVIGNQLSSSSSGCSIHHNKITTVIVTVTPALLLTSLTTYMYKYLLTASEKYSASQKHCGLIGSKQLLH